MLSLMRPTQLLPERSDNLGIGYWVFGIGCWVLGVGFWVLGVSIIWEMVKLFTSHYSLFQYSLFTSHYSLFHGFILTILSSLRITNSLFIFFLNSISFS
jgi:hypothetical protein